MTESTGSGMESTIAQLSKKIDEQARFTRSVTIICTLTILGVMFYTLTEMFSNLPGAIILHYMANLEKIVTEWNAIQNVIEKKGQRGEVNPNVTQSGKGKQQ